MSSQPLRNSPCNHARDGLILESVPATFFIRDGEILERMVGPTDRNEITEKAGEYYYG